MEKLFHLKENNTTVRTEIVAGLTTFMTMAYIIALNPNLLTGFGAQGGSQLWNGVFLATCIASAVGTLVMAFAANKPFAMAPGMGLNSFFAVVVANIVTLTGMSYLQSFQTALCVILIEGIVFIILSVLKVREKIVEAIPLGIRLGIAPAIGLMLLNIGIGSNAGVYSSDGGPFYVMRDFFGALTPSLAKANMGDGYPQMVLTVVTMFVGLFLIVLFAHKKIKGSVLLGMLCASGIYWAGEAIFLHTNPFASLKGASFVPAFGDMAETTLFKFDFADPDWGGNYRYAFGYYVLVAWYIVLFVIFFATLFLSARRSLRSMLFPIGVIVGVGVVYGVMFTLRHVATLTSNVALTYCILAMVAIELTLDLGFFPSYAWYTLAFSKLPFDLKVLEANGDTVFQTEMAQPMPQAAADTLKTADKGLGESWAFRTTGAPHTLFKVYPVSGGRAVLAEDVAAIDERREALAATQERLRRSNAVLEREAEVQHEMWRLRSERELFVEIEKSLESKTRRIQMLLDSLPGSNDPDSIARRREMLVEVKLLVAYCKRKGALVLAEKSDPEFNRERLQLVFNETAADLRSIGVECAALVQTNTPLPASVVSVLYDCLYDFATVANAASDAVLMLFVQQDERRVQLRAMLDSSDAESERMAATFDELRASLEKHRVEYSIETDSSSASLVAYVPLPTKGGK